jgi:hypothetical protein
MTPIFVFDYASFFITLDAAIFPAARHAMLPLFRC